MEREGDGLCADVADVPTLPALGDPNKDGCWLDDGPNVGGVDERWLGVAFRRSMRFGLAGAGAAPPVCTGAA